MKFSKLLLVEDVPRLGTKGDVIKVKLGYARNYLLPKGLAVHITKENLRQIEINKKREFQAEEERKEEIKKIANDLELVACTIESKANEEGHLFGSVTYPIIAEKLQGMGFDVKAEDIELEDTTQYPIKEIGIFIIQIRLHPEIIAKSKVFVAKEE